MIKKNEIDNNTNGDNRDQKLKWWVSSNNNNSNITSNTCKMMIYKDDNYVIN